LSPVGLSAVTKLAPKKIVGMVMGAWFLSISAGHKIAGFVNALAGSKPELANALTVFDRLEKAELEIGSAEGATFVAEQVAELSNGNADMSSKLTTLLQSPVEEVTQQTLVTYLGVYNMLCWIAVGAGILLMLASPLLKKWQHGVK
jgi:dipeptide/tripeptide permease